MSQAALDSTLQVRTPSTLQQVPVPVEVRNASMQLVARGQTGEMIRLARGQYIVSLSLPFGAKENRVVDVDPDHPGDLSIDWELPRGAAPVPPADGGPTGFESRVRGLDLGTAGPRRPVPGWLARFLVFKDGRSEVADQPPLLEVDDVEREDGRMDVFMFAHARTPELPFLQLAGDGLTPIVLALPIAGGSGAHVCTLHVTTTAGGISAAASPRGDTRTQVVAGYLEGGIPERQSMCWRAQRTSCTGRSRTRSARP